MPIYQAQPTFDLSRTPLVDQRGMANRAFALWLQTVLTQAVRPVPTKSTFAAIPVRTNYYGETAWVTDSTTVVLGAVIAGGGANEVLGMWDGTNWVVVGGSTAGGGAVLTVTATAPIASTGGVNPVISHNTTAVVAGSYTNTALTVDSRGHLTAASSGTAPVTSVTGTPPIASSGGTTPAISLNDTAVTPGSYTYASLTVDQQGRLTAASSGTAPVTTDYVVMSDGSTPPSPMDDGGSNFIYVPYTP